ncbi:phage tail tube protein [Amycolatopsis sp. BJA-103]|uniref:phage tail tube protein n=1 Tax=Amycolatopsis sp. BJA-103 TaxID=1911175 RepID=UPI000C7941E7|nr:hypothetical protein [Amycolatopsis sp. BJA-103]AUI56777.1 hypothetical protein BKN51_00155 [Amycolatopsis sp. BJA-103]PNE13097.1 hypothetical protein B1H26_42390 [Amycolatopsis sp. BJA-103]
MASILKRLSRKWTIEVNTGTNEAQVWSKVKGLTKLELGIDANSVDTTDFDSEGWEDNDTTFRKWSLGIEGFDGFTGPVNAQVDDPGQAFLKMKGLLTGPEAKVEVRVYRLDNNKGYSGLATSNWAGAGGEVKNMEPFKCDLTGSGLLSPFVYTP